MRNQEVAAILDEVADILDLQGIKFKPQAYRRAARSIERFAQPIETVEDLKSIPGVGDAIAKKIEEILKTGKLQYLETLKKEIPQGMEELMLLPEIGPKTAQYLATQGIHSIKDLEKALTENKIEGMKGFGPKTVENLKRALELHRSQKGRRLLGKILPLCRMLEEALAPHAEEVVTAGSIRRWKETVGDIDILVVSSQPERVMEVFTSLPLVLDVLSQGSTRSSVILQKGIQADVRVVPRESFGAALQYFTGSKEHNISLRDIAIKKGFKLSEYGLFERESEKKIAGETEGGIYHALGLQYIPPELREDQGEVEAAKTNALPDLVTRGQVRGDLHVHTDWSDGKDSIEAMVVKAKQLNYAYLGIADHSRSLKIGRGLSVEKLLNQHAFIKELNDRTDITVFSGTECDILADGSLDYPDSVLEELDFVIASIHSRFKSTREEMTARMVKVMENPYVKVIGHPTGRIIGRREPLNLDVETLFEKAADAKIALEINCYPDRLDLKDAHVRKAGEYGVFLTLGTDSHAARDMDFIELGVGTARRGWAGPADILNTRSHPFAR